MRQRLRAPWQLGIRADRGCLASGILALIRRPSSRGHSSAWRTCAGWAQKSLVILLMLVTPAAAVAQPVLGQPNLKALFEVVGRMHNIDAELLAAMAEVESGGDPSSVSPKGAIGLMQLMPATASEFSVLDPFDPVASVIGAADFLDYLRNRFASKLDLQGLPVLLAAYNAGPGAVEKYGGIPPYAETHKYVQRVIARYASDHSARPTTAPVLILTPAPYLIQIDPQSNEARAEPVLINADRGGATLNRLAAIRPASEPVLAAVGTGTAPWLRRATGLPRYRIHGTGPGAVSAIVVGNQARPSTKMHPRRGNAGRNRKSRSLRTTPY
jgi:hypothetical protein